MSHESADCGSDSTGWQSKYAEIASLAGSLAHEIRNPLSTMSLHLELLSEDLADSDQPRDRRLRQRVQAVQKECSHLEQILNDFLEYARAHALRLTTTSLNDEVRSFIEFFGPRAAEQGVEVSPHLAAHLPLARIDHRVFRQALQNLAQNALQAMPNGGRLELLTYESDGSPVLEFIDTGCGMDPATRDRMFDIFFSTKANGSGLGLPMVQRIVEAHGGTIVCESSVGVGTKFRITLPGLPQPALMATTASSSEG